MTTALILVDLQHDFLPGGALGVPEGDVAAREALALAKSGRFDHVVATQDWHPADHRSFAANDPQGRDVGTVVDLDGLDQVLWPVHCVQGSHGAALVEDVMAEVMPGGCVETVVRKGTDAGVDSYSGFFDNGRRHATGLADWLRAHHVERVVVCGLATDYCVKWTALDAVEQGFQTTLARWASRGVELNPGDVDAAVAEMRAAGVCVAAGPGDLGDGRGPA